MLLSEEQKQILALQERLDNPVRRSEETSAVIAEAIRLRQDQGGGGPLRDALAPSIEETLRESVRKDSSILADVLFPVMGPAIRKAVAESIRTLIESFNKALESSLSIQGLKWRFEAIRTGRSYAEVALLRSIVYRVEQVFVVHKKTSLLLLHAVGPDVTAKDADMVSGMLSAIQDFVRDSFQADQGEALDRLQVGELQVWVEHGPHATIAAVIRGEVPQSYRLLLREKLEKFHQQFGAALQGFEGDAAAFEPFRPNLDDCLVAHFKEKQRESRPYFLALVLVLMSGCVAVKNQAPLVPSPRIAAAWEPRYPSSIQVRLPALESLPATSPSVYQWQIDVVRQDARRLAGILSKCRLFSDVVLSNSAPGTNVIVVEALPRPPSLADPDSAWLLLSGGVIPYYDRVDVGVRFRFVNGEGNDFVFPWTTRYVIGFWAPAVVGIGPGWRFGVLGLLNPANPDSTYWIDLRSALIEVMDRIVSRIFSRIASSSAALRPASPHYPRISAIAMNAAAYFVGYVSFITPSGMGFREASLAFLLAHLAAPTGLVVATLLLVCFSNDGRDWQAASIAIHGNKGEQS